MTMSLSPVMRKSLIKKKLLETEMQCHSPLWFFETKNKITVIEINTRAQRIFFNIWYIRYQTFLSFDKSLHPSSRDAMKYVIELTKEKNHEGIFHDQEKMIDGGYKV